MNREYQLEKIILELQEENRLLREKYTLWKCESCKKRQPGHKYRCSYCYQTICFNCLESFKNNERLLKVCKNCSFINKY